MPALYGSNRARRFLRDCVDGADAVDLLWVGDSNTGYNGYGWVDGFAGGLTRAGAQMYGTSVYTAGNEYGESGYRSRQWTFMGAGSPTGYLPLSTSAASASLKLTMGRGSGSLTIDGSAFEGGSISATNFVQNEWALWIYGRGPDGTFTEPCPIGLDNELVWRGQCNILSGGNFKAHWLTLANAELVSAVNFNTVSATPDAWDTVSATLPAGSRLSSLTAAGTGIKVGLAGTGVGGPNQINGPVRIGLHSVYTPRKGYSSSVFEWRGGATLTQICDDVTQASSAASSLHNFLRYLRERQIAATGSGRVVFCLQGGVNSGDWTVDGETVVIARIDAMLASVRSVWEAAGYPESDLAFLVMASHVFDADDASIGRLREAMRNRWTTSEDVTFVDLNAVAPFERITEEGWYDSLGEAHLEELRGGYEAIASIVVAQMVSEDPNQFLTLSQLKDALKIEYTDDDAELQRLLSAAESLFERRTGRYLRNAPRSMKLKGWSRALFTHNPVQSVTSVTYVDSSGATVEMPGSDYFIDDTEELPAIEFLEAPSMKVGSSITVGFRAGHDDIPREAIQALIALVGHWYNNPEASQPVSLSTVPMSLEFIMDSLSTRGPFR